MKTLDLQAHSCSPLWFSKQKSQQYTWGLPQKAVKHTWWSSVMELDIQVASFDKSSNQKVPFAKSKHKGAWAQPSMNLWIYQWSAALWGLKAVTRE